jgi:ArsR family transcriptional regulator, arsenate/arsenite/antimonite-responsive transcriptional repressor
MDAMETRIKEYLKDRDICCEEYVEKYQEFAKKISESEEFKTKLKRYSALSNKNRFLIYSLIENAETCNCALAKIVGLTEGSITHHIKILQEAGLVIGKNQGHFTTYYTPENLKKDL